MIVVANLSAIVCSSKFAFEFQFNRFNYESLMGRISDGTLGLGSVNMTSALMSVSLQNFF